MVEHSLAPIQTDLGDDAVPAVPDLTGVMGRPVSADTVCRSRFGRRSTLSLRLLVHTKSASKATRVFATKQALRLVLCFFLGHLPRADRSLEIDRCVSSPDRTERRLERRSALGGPKILSLGLGQPA